MVMNIDSSPASKRSRFVALSPMEVESVKARFAAAREKYGRQIRVFETSIASATTDSVSDIGDTDAFYEFTAEDYYRLAACKKEDKYLKTKKIRDAEEAARRSRITKAVMRVRFPDDLTLEATFHPSETIQSLVDLLKKVVAHPELPFYLYTTPPKKQVKDLSQNYFSAGFVPGAIVYFAYDAPKGDGDAPLDGLFLQEDVISLKGLEELLARPSETETETSTKHANEQTATSYPVIPKQKSSDKKKSKPRWWKT